MLLVILWAFIPSLVRCTIFHESFPANFTLSRNLLIKDTNQCFINPNANLSVIPPKLYQTQKTYEIFESNVDLFELYSKFASHFILNSTKISKKCRSANADFSRRLQDYEINAVKLFDASAKLPSGILSGNLNQYGDFDECISVPDAQYCLADIDLRQVWRDPFLKFKDLVHAHFAFKEEFDDPKHRVPGFVMARWGFCISASCSNDDLKNHLEETFGVKADIQQNMCQRAKIMKKPTVGDYVARFLFSTLILFVLTGSILSFYQKSQESGNKSTLYKCLLAFSVSDNWRRLWTTNTDGKTIKAVHGIRGFSALALIMSHKAVSSFYNPYINRTKMVEINGLPWSVIGRTAIIYTDSFIFISGFLTASALLEDLMKGNGLRFKDKLISRIFRITPSLIAVIVFCTYLLPNLGSGPIWPIVVDHHSDLCKQYMWRNIFYIHNYFGFENMCLTHTHQVGIDMQLFLTAPIFVYILWTNRKMGMWLIGIVATLSTVLRLWVSWQKELSHMVHFGIPVSRMFRTADYSYILPTHRATVYLMGITLAYIMKTKQKIIFSKVQLGIYWIMAVTICFTPMILPYHMATKGYVYNIIDGMLYGTLSPIFWGTGIAWAIYTANNGYAGWFGDFLSWKGFEVFTKISYAVYLVQFPVFFYNVGVTRHAGEYSSRMLMEIPETLMIIIVSTILTLLVEMPFQNIKRILFDRGVRAKIK